MGDVVYMADYRPHITTRIVCKGCGHDWEAHYPETEKSVECPGCHEMVYPTGLPVRRYLEFLKGDGEDLE